MKSRKAVLGIGAVVVIAALAVGGGLLGSRLSAQKTATMALVSSFSNPSGDITAIPAVLNTPTQSSDVSHAFQDQFREIASEIRPVVVEVNVATTVTQQIPTSPFDFFFGTPGQSQPQQREFTQRGLGSGVVVARNGKKVYVLTNNHVAGDADQIEIVLADGRTYDAELVGGDSLMDLALVSFETTDDVPVATLGDSDSLMVGDWVFAAGNPLGFQSTITSGIVSALERTPQPGSGMSGITDYIQTDAAINQGNSGGPLVNIDGDVVGINTWIASQSGGSIGLGFAIPINAAKRAIADFLAYGQVSYSWLGVQAGDIGSQVRDDFQLGKTTGAFVYGVYEDSPGAAAGIQPGDVIEKVGEATIDGANSLIKTIAALPPGDEINITLVRDGHDTAVTVRTTARDENSGTDSQNLWPGISVVPLTDDIRSQLSLKSSVHGVTVVGVAQGSVAESSGIRQGDTITAVNGHRITSAHDFYRELRQSTNDEVQFRVARGDQQVILGFVRPAA